MEYGALTLEKRAAAAVALCTLLLAGCETVTAPVSERQVGDYRKAPVDSEGRSSPSTTLDNQRAPRAPASTAAAKTAKDAAPANTRSATAGTQPGAKPGPDVPTDGTGEDWRPATYVVKRGDTLYAIALDHGLDYKDLTAWNQLGDPNLIKVGQTLSLRPPPGWKADPADADLEVARAPAATPAIQVKPLEAAPKPSIKAGPKGIRVAYSDAALAQLTRDPDKIPAAESKPASPSAEPEIRSEPLSAPPAVAPPAAAPVPSQASAPGSALAPPKPADKPAAAPSQEGLEWRWPTSGKLLHAFNQGAMPKGVAIGGTPGQPVVASAAGKVVYSGSGLRGYGKLIIIKHNNTYLSVYAHNRELLVKEGDRVSRGQKIAEMGGTDADRTGLHFEIRRLGKPVDPLKYLPREGA